MNDKWTTDGKKCHVNNFWTVFASEGFEGNKSMEELNNAHWVMLMFLKINSHFSKTE